MASVIVGVAGGVVATIVMTIAMTMMGDGGPPPTAPVVAKFAGGTGRCEVHRRQPRGLRDARDGFARDVRYLRCSPAGVATAPMVMAVEKSTSPFTNQKVSRDGANGQPFRIAATYPVEKDSSWANGSLAAARMAVRRSNTETTRYWNASNVIQSWYPMASWHHAVTVGL
jgi:hypothetical protein